MQVQYRMQWMHNGNPWKVPSGHCSGIWCEGSANDMGDPQYSDEMFDAYTFFLEDASTDASGYQLRCKTIRAWSPCTSDDCDNE